MILTASTLDFGAIIDFIHVRLTLARGRSPQRQSWLPQDIINQRIRRHSTELCERHRICLAPVAALIADEQNFKLSEVIRQARDWSGIHVVLNRSSCVLVAICRTTVAGFCRPVPFNVH